MASPGKVLSQTVSGNQAIEQIISSLEDDALDELDTLLSEAPPEIRLELLREFIDPEKLFARKYGCGNAAGV